MLALTLLVGTLQHVLTCLPQLHDFTGDVCPIPHGLH